jgi:hemerythrin
MQFFEWNEEYSVGVPTLDEEHKVFIGHFNTLYEAIQFGRAPDILIDLFDKLVAYAFSHFGHEEKIMRATAYPDYESHKAQHDDIKARLLDLQKRTQEQKSISVGLSNEVFAFLKGWLTQHLLQKDKTFSSHFIAHGIQ